MLTQLPVPLPLETPKGKAWAVAIIDYGPHWDLQWVTFIHATGECWTFLNRDIRQEQNQTFGLPRPTAIAGESYSSASAVNPEAASTRRPPPEQFLTGSALS